MAFDAILHLATAAAIIIVFSKEISLFFGGWQRGNNFFSARASWEFLGLIVLASVPAAGSGILFEVEVESTLRSTLVVALALIGGAIFLFWADRYIEKAAKKTAALKEIRWQQALVVGLCQAVALIPGTSRSAATITGGMFLKMNRKTAVKFSFLVGLPAVAGAGFFELIKLARLGTLSQDGAILSLGFLSAFVAGILSLRLLLWLADRTNFNIFVIYRIALGIVLLLFLKS